MGRGEGTWEMDDGDLQMALEEGASIGGDIEVYDVGGHQDDDVSLEEKEIMDFRLREEEHEIAFNGLPRLSCFAHTVQLVTLKFNKDKHVASVLKRVTAMVRSANTSKNVTELLIKETGVKLIGACPTRWSSTFLMIERLLRVQDTLTRFWLT